MNVLMAFDSLCGLDSSRTLVTTLESRFQIATGAEVACAGDQSKDFAILWFRNSMCSSIRNVKTCNHILSLGVMCRSNAEGIATDHDCC